MTAVDKEGRTRMGTGTGPALDELVSGLALELGDASSLAAGAAVAEGAEGGVTTWQRAGKVFARASASVLEVHLPGDIAEAALRTPDTAPISGEPGWVRFAPSSDERHVSDRAEAWFQTAWRHASDAAEGDR